MMEKFIISSRELTFSDLEKIIDNKLKIELSPERKEAIKKCRLYLDEKLSKEEKPVYGINTGFGSLCNHRISNEQLSTLQENLVKSHACGCGDEIPQEVTRMMILLKIQSLSYGHSGVQLETVERLVDFFNNDIIPVVYQMGSLGASGDLAPLAHVSLPLIGLGEVYYKGVKTDAASVLQDFGWSPIQLKSKEGLALLNGTQFMSAFGVITLIKAFHLAELADIIGAVSLDAFDGRIEPFNDLVHQIRHHKGQIDTAARFRYILKDSTLISREKQHVQDPYSFRCIPQVHGASKDVIDFAAHVFACEINAVTDNPTIFPDEDEIISGGNFHGQPLALALDSLAIALAELGNISERRTYQLVSGKRNLPPFLVAEPGLNSGFMIPQYTAASIVSQNKQLCTPASVDSIESSQGQEDHVSMGANAATKCFKVAQNLERILAIELFNAAQALEFRRPQISSPFIEDFVSQYRSMVHFVDNDTTMYPLIHNSVQFLHNVEYSLPKSKIDTINI
ncbi:MAG: histidine ammonia-lyase [Marinilabiliales bacterium]|nr:MAG: histidine ammonia-lyase [Marinilabiliales bacterium]